MGNHRIAKWVLEGGGVIEQGRVCLVAAGKKWWGVAGGGGKVAWERCTVVMAILVILVSSDSSEDCVETPAGQVILFDTIPTTIPDTTPVIAPPTTQTDTTVIPTKTPNINPKKEGKSIKKFEEYVVFPGQTLPGETSDEMYMKEEEVVFTIHTKGYYEYDPLRYVNGSVSCFCAFTHDKDVFPRWLNHIMSEIDEHKWALFYRVPKKSFDKGLKLLHTDNDVHSFFNDAEEDDAGLRCSSSTPFDIRFKRKINKSKKTGVIHDKGTGRKRKKSLVNGGNKGKEKVFEDDGTDKKRKKTLVNGGNKGKEKYLRMRVQIKSERKLLLMEAVREKKWYLRMSVCVSMEIKVL
uniref:Uncharacterized protein n=1 Tax=Tanacetum cinerariifolium TaxID=118510 RepID=A0A6L2P6G7_TANCI|nr:hypothetical protein [Tanacetum cinerariifolium]